LLALRDERRYVVAENAVLLRAGGYAFFRAAARRAAAGSVFVFAETTHRLWPAIARAAIGACDGDDAARDGGDGDGDGAAARRGGGLAAQIRELYTQAPAAPLDVSPHVVGGARTGWGAAGPSLSLARVAALSGAAVDGLVLATAAQGKAARFWLQARRRVAHIYIYYIKCFFRSCWFLPSRPPSWAISHWLQDTVGGRCSFVLAVQSCWQPVRSAV
jgi:hypothetical protein